MGLDQKVVNAIRILSAEGVQKAKSGHPGMPMGAAAMAYAVWGKHMVHTNIDPKWDNRDRFVLSSGHGSMLIYSLLHLARERGGECPLSDPDVAEIERLRLSKR